MEEMKMKRKIITTLTLTFAVATVFVSGPLIMITGAAGKEENSDNSMYANSAEVIAAEGCTENLEVNWGEKVDEITAAIMGANGGVVDVVTGDKIEVPSDVLRFIAGSNACVALHARPGLGFTVSGRDVEHTAETLNINVSSSGVPEAVRQALVTDALAYCEFNLGGTDVLPFRMNVHMNFGQQYAGKGAVFYSYDEQTHSLKPMGVFRTNENGQAMFELTRGGAYLTVVMEQDYIVKSGDTLSHIASKHGTTVNALKAVNPQIKDADVIRPGEVIRLY